MRRSAFLFAPALFLTLSLPPSAFADEHQVPNPQGALAGKNVILSPGHGYQIRNGVWVWQRPLLHQIREGIHTNEVMMEVARHLASAGARVESCRERSYQTAEVVVDETDAGYRETGNWTSSSFAARRHGATYRYAQVAAQESATAEFTPTLPRAGRYPVYVWYTQGSNRTGDALYRVHHAGGVSEVRRSQGGYGGHWTFLGEWYFEAGTRGKVVVSNQGSDPTKFVIVDAVRFGGGVGASGQARWREGAKAFIHHKGFSSTRGGVTIRPEYATWLAGGYTGRWRDDFMLVSLHTNAGGGRGTVCFSFGDGRNGIGPAGYHPTTPSPLRSASDRLRDRLQAELVRGFREHVDPNWRDRGTGWANFGQLRESRTMPSCLIELAFHDSAEDAAHLRNSRYRRVSARAIYKAILRSFVPNATVTPLPPQQLRIENLGGGEVRISWAATPDPLEPSAVPNGYKVYLSRNGLGWDDGVELQSSSYVVKGLQEGDTIYAKVSGTNAGGEGLAGRVGGARVGEPQARALLVDGFTRAYSFTHENGPRRYTYDYAHEHVSALAAALPSHAALDYTEQAGVGATVQLGDYAFVDWHLGRESSLDRTFDASDQQLVQSYLSGGGSLLVSGTEIGWDLGARSGGVSFLADALGGIYERDDAGVTLARPTRGSPFAGIGNLNFDSGRYVPSTPDVFRPASGAEVLLAYETAGAPAAAVGRNGQVVTLGFPLETVGDLGQRTRIAEGALSYLDPVFPPPTATPAPVSSAPVTSTTAPAATASPGAGGGGGGGGGGCSLGSEQSLGGASLIWFLLLCGGAALARRPEPPCVA